MILYFPVMSEEYPITHLLSQSSLGMYMDRGAWLTIVYGIAKS